MTKLLYLYERAIRDCRHSPGLVLCGVCVVLCGVCVQVCYIINEQKARVKSSGETWIGFELRKWR